MDVWGAIFVVLMMLAGIFVGAFLTMVSISFWLGRRLRRMWK